MLLEGHQGEIFTAKFHPEGKHLASAGFDRQICKIYPLNTLTAFLIFLSQVACTFIFYGINAVFFYV